MKDIRVLFIADETDKALYDHYEPERLKDVDLIISCGDLNPHYLEFLVTVGHAPLLYVRGNHDDNYKRYPPLGCECIEDRIYDFRGLRILGLGGAMRYKPGENMYSESEMKRRIQKLNMEIYLKNGFDMLVTHAPAAGYGDLTDLPHKGYKCFNSLMEKHHPKYMVHGHVHQSYGDFQRIRMHESGTTIINAYSKYMLTIGADQHPEEGRTGSPLYDLYKNVSMKHYAMTHHAGR